MDKIEDVLLEVGDPESTRAFKTRVTPADMDGQLLRITTVQLKRRDGSLVELPGFMEFDEEDFSLKI